MHNDCLLFKSAFYRPYRPVGAVDLEFLDLLAQIMAPAASAGAANARQMAKFEALAWAG